MGNVPTARVGAADLTFIAQSTATLHDTTTRHRRIVTAFGDFDRTTAWSLDITERSDSQSAAQRSAIQNDVHC